MDDIINHIKESIEDQLFSRAEKRNLKSMIKNEGLDQHQINFIRGQVFDIANEHVNSDNYGLVIRWLEEANKALIVNNKTEESDVLFSPGSACKNAILYNIHSAIKTIDICVFTISDNDIRDGIVSAHKKGISVKIITDNDKTEDRGSDIDYLADKGLPVKIDNTSNHMHHKFAIMDSSILITGSYNWTRSAEKYNHENILLSREKGPIKQYQREFDKLWKEMAAY